MIIEKYPLGERPFVNAEIPYGFKQLWVITATQYDLTSLTFSATDVTQVVLNGQEITTEQATQLFDYTRDIASLAVAGSNGVLITINSYDTDTQLFHFTVLSTQTLDIVGVLGVTGDMVDNTDPNRPIILHDTQKVDRTVYDADKAALDSRLTQDEQAIADLGQSVQEQQINGLTGIDLNGTAVPVTSNRAQLVIDYIDTPTLSAALGLKVDKSIAGSLVSDVSSTLGADGVLTTTKVKRDVSTGVETPTTTTMDLRTGLGIDKLTALDVQHSYYFNSDSIPSFNVPVDVPLSALYRYSEDGTIYNPTSTDDVMVVYAQAEDYSDFNVLRRYYIIAVGEVTSYTTTAVTTSFTRMGATRLYNQYNAVRQGTLVYDNVLGSTFYTLQDVPRPTSAVSVIPLTNAQYYKAIKDYSPMDPGTVFANFETTEGAGDAYSTERTRLELIRLGSGYGDYISFRTPVIPPAINNATEWNDNVDLWVTDGYQFTSLASLLAYLANFTTAERFKMSNNGLVRTHYASGGITITPVFTADTLGTDYDSKYQPILTSSAAGQLSAYDSNGVLAPSAFTPASFATSAQGARADTAVQLVTLQPGATNGTVTITVDGVQTQAAVTGLNSAAYKSEADFATAAQGILANSSVQSVTLQTGSLNGTVRVVVNGTPGNDVSVAGLGSAAFQDITAFATAAQGVLATSAIQTITFSTGNANGTFLVSVDGEPAQEVLIAGLGSAAFQPSSAFATAAQGTLAASALQRSDVIDNATSASVDLPVSANQVRLLSQRLAAITGSGRPIGGFSTYADRYTNTSQYAADLQPILVGDEIYIAADENHTNQSARYRVAAVSGTGDITYSFLGIVPDVARDFIFSPIQSNELADGAVGTAHLQGQAVTTPKIASNAVTLSKLSVDVQTSLAKADTSIQSPITTIGNGSLTGGVALGTENILEVTQKNLADVMTVSVTGGGQFLTGGSISTNRLDLVKDGVAIQTVQYTGTGDMLVNATVSGNVLTFTRAPSFSSLTINGTGNAIVNATSAGVLTKGTLVATVSKTGTGNVITGSTTDTTGNVSLASGNAFDTVNAQGSGNFIADITTTGNVLNVTRGTALTSVPDASTTQKGVVQLNNTVTSTSTIQALTAAQGKVLQDQINLMPDRYVGLTGNQTISDIKIFEMHPQIPAKSTLPSAPLQTQYATEAQVATRLAIPSVGVQNNIPIFGANKEVVDSGVSIGNVPSTVIADADIDIYVNNVWGA